MDLDKIKALALAAPKDWYGIYQIADGVTDNDAAALMKACSPATVLELIAEVERLRHQLANVLPPFAAPASQQESTHFPRRSK